MLLAPLQLLLMGALLATFVRQLRGPSIVAAVGVLTLWLESQVREFELDSELVFVTAVTALPIYSVVKATTRSWASFAVVLGIAFFGRLVAEDVVTLWLFPEQSTGSWLTLETWFAFVPTLGGLMWLVANVVVVGTAFMIAGALGTPLTDVRSPRSGMGDVAMTNEGDNATRLVAASCILDASLRRSVIERARDPVHASALEMGLDFDLVLRVALAYARRETLYQLAFLALGLLAAVVGANDVGTGVLIGMGLVALGMYRAYDDRFVECRAFRREEYTPAKIEELYPGPLPADMPGTKAAKQTNVAVYSGFSPFEGCGVATTKWSLTIDVTRPKKDTIGRTVAVRSIEPSDIERIVERRIANAGLPNVAVKDCLFLNGADAASAAGLLHDRFEAPTQLVEPSHLVTYEHQTKGIARRYKWIRASSWGGELVTSTFFRCADVGSSLSFECAHYVLAPLADEYRAIDRLPNETWFAVVRQTLLGGASGPIFAVVSPFLLLAKLKAKLTNMLWGECAAIRRTIRTQQRFNYGARLSLRQSVAASNYRHYFQVQDEDAFRGIVDKRIMRAVIDVLDDHGIDTSDIENQTNHILNQGIIVQGGNIEAQSLAVGQGSQARTSGVFSRLKGSAPGAAKAPAA